jgi:hypothetical protein
VSYYSLKDYVNKDLNQEFYKGSEKQSETPETIIIKKMIDHIQKINSELIRQRMETEKELETMKVIMNDVDNKIIKEMSTSIGIQVIDKIIDHTDRIDLLDNMIKVNNKLILLKSNTPIADYTRNIPLL